jgi:hypothetical protein
LYVLDWENPEDWTVPGHPPPGWSYEYQRHPDQIHHDDGEPPVRVAFAANGEPVRAGGHSVRFELDRRDGPVNNGSRAEIGAEDPVEPRGAERWYGFSTYLPPNMSPHAREWTFDSAPEIIAQWHQVGGDCTTSVGCSPPLSLITEKGQYKISQNWQKNAGVSGKWDFSSISIGPYETGRWTDWVFHVIWSTDPNKGRLEILKDGNPVTGYEAKDSPRRTDDFGDGKSGNYMVLGIYKWFWSQNKPTDATNRVLYVDELRIADQTGTKDKVAPPQAAGPGHGTGRLALYHPLQVTPGTANAPGKPGQPTTATFTVINDGGSPATVPTFVAGARTNTGTNVDFPASSPVTLWPNETYTYRASRSFNAGDFIVWPAYNDGANWIEIGERFGFTVQ